MNRLKNILVVASPHNLDLHIVERAGSLALLNKGQLSIALLAPDPEIHPLLEKILGVKTSLTESLRDEFCQQLRPVLRPLQTAGIQTDVSVFSGTAFIAIIRDVIQNRRDLVMVSNLPEAGRESGTSSLIQHLVRKCPCPVWALRANSRSALNQIVAAVDVTHQDEADRALHQRVLDLSTSLAAVEGGKVLIVHAWEIPGESLLDSALAKVAEPEVQAFAHEVEQERRALFEAVVAPTRNAEVPVQAIMRRGNPARVIRSVVQASDADLLVMGSVHRIRIRGFFIGNTAEQVMQQVPCSVISVKPEGFQSPVELPPAYQSTSWKSLFEAAARQENEVRTS